MKSPTIHQPEVFVQLHPHMFDGSILFKTPMMLNFPLNHKLIISQHSSVIDPQ